MQITKRIQAKMSLPTSSEGICLHFGKRARLLQDIYKHHHADRAQIILRAQMQVSLITVPS